MTDAIHQDDLMAQLLASHPNVGRLAWFTVDEGLVDQQQWLQGLMRAGLTAYGAPKGIPATTAYLRGLRSMQAAAPGRTLIRRVERERGRTVHHWIEETVSGGQVHFRPLAAIARDTKHDIISIQRLDQMTSEQDDALSRLPEFVDTAQRTFTAGDRRRQIRGWFSGVGALQMAHAGPMQFIPETAVGLIDALNQAQNDLGIHVWSMPLTRSADVIGTLTQSLDDEVTRKTAALLKSVQDAKKAGKTPSTASQAKLVQQLKELDSRVQRYSGLFGEQLDNLTTQIAIARQAVRSALVE
ncbi:DUF6744 family protein [Sulfobacillus harzensis]|uniref:Uncharacterized protein n=1 Tax=Sulfobacillus harzensis TaxID=2729629 RepID=A0A7Y0L3P4_9FIRM|nr:DUF6744 family protein [Sulfobacillus harzensis]NMP22645.1 hypothetical protein [Sulfobacillus harzensis]